MAKRITSVPQIALDARIEVIDDLYGKYNRSNLIDNDFTDGFQFLPMKREVYPEEFQWEDGTRTSRIRGDFKGLQKSKLFSLRNLPVFGTQLAAMQCTKLLASRKHGGCLWLDREYPIHTEDIYRLTGLANMGNVVSAAFQTGAKRGKKPTEDNIYTRYGMEQGGKGAKLDKINKDNIRFACYQIARKTMRHFTRNEYTLDTVSIAEHCYQGEILNWATFVLNKLFEVCEDVYRWSTGFVFEYLVMTLAMWKWRPPPERQMATIAEDQPIALRYEPWRASGDPNVKEINEATFRGWYAQMVDAI